MHCKHYMCYLDSIYQLHGNTIPHSFSLQTIAFGKESVIVSVQNQNERNICHKGRAYAHSVGCQSNCMIQSGTGKKSLPRKGRLLRGKHVLAGAADSVAC
jgi:hypothetical protein